MRRDESEASGPRSRQLSLLDTSAQERRPVPIRRRHREEVIWPNCRVYPMLASTCTRSASTPPTHRSEGRVISPSILAPCPPGLRTPVLHPCPHPIIGSSSESTQVAQWSWCPTELWDVTGSSTALRIRAGGAVVVVPDRALIRHRTLYSSSNPSRWRSGGGS